MSVPDSDAAYYQAHKDDPEEWEDYPAPARRTPRRRLAAMVSVRFSPTELELLRRAADRRGDSLSAFVRAAALGATYQPFTVVSITGVRTADIWVHGTAGHFAVSQPAVIGLPRWRWETTGVH